MEAASILVHIQRCNKNQNVRVTYRHIYLDLFNLENGINYLSQLNVITITTVFQIWGVHSLMDILQAGECLSGQTN